MIRKTQSRGRNLDDRSIENIVITLDNWMSTKLTWNLLIDEIHKNMGILYSRQALNNHTRIREAFVARKLGLSAHSGPTKSHISLESQRITRLEAENERLKRENNNLLEQFQRWVYNGYLKQMDDKMREHMNQPLPRLHRDRS